MPGFRILPLCALFLTPFLSAAEDYAIRFERPAKVGDRYTVTSKGTQNRVVTAKAGERAMPEQREVLAADLTAEVEVLAVSPKGKEQKIRLTGTKLAFQSNSRATEVFPEGTEVLVEYGDKKSKYTVAGNPADQNSGKALGLVIKLSSDDSSDDVMFGTAQRQKIGQRWPLNAAAAAASFSARFGNSINPDDLQGGWQIQEVVSTPGGEALRLVGDLTILSFKVPLPNGLTVRQGTSKSTLTGLLPVDLSKGTLEQSSKTETEIVADGENKGVKIELTTKGVDTREIRFAYK